MGIIKTVGPEWAIEKYGGGELVPIVEDGRPASEQVLNKLASQTYIPPSLETKIAELRSNPIRDWTIFYNRAMGASDSYGPNNNGDSFSRYWLTRNHPTFVSHGHMFRHHQSSDPANAIGRIFASGYNDPLDLVDLITGAPTAQIESDMARAQASGGVIATSMGAKVPYDVCSICGNRARTRALYCTHARHHMLRLIDGRLVYVDNPNPTFKDLSIVIIGADPVSMMLRKVANNITEPPPLTAHDLNIMGRTISQTSSAPRRSVDPVKLASWMDRYPKADLFATLDRGIGPLRPDEFLAIAYDDASMVRPKSHTVVNKVATMREPYMGEVDMGMALACKFASASLDPVGMEIYPMSQPELQAYCGYRLQRDPNETEYFL